MISFEKYRENFMFTVNSVSRIIAMSSSYPTRRATQPLLTGNTYTIFRLHLTCRNQKKKIRLPIKKKML